MTVENQLALITSKLLPDGFDFFDQQKEAILADGSVNVVAGPGTGKTTVLIAKLALLLQQNPDINQGICLITHTNVAVDEIKNGLKKIGISNVEYPNFIGTIQDFFNTFFAKKAFHIIHGDKIFRAVDDDEYKKKFDDIFELLKPEWYNHRPPNIRKASPKIVISDDLSFSVFSNANHRYKQAFENSIKRLFNMGILNNEQCLELSNWYIERFEEPIRNAIIGRFKYVLLDEAQDTGPLQYNLLNKLFSNKKVSFQKFGDPYQALYTIFEGNNDAWIPIRESEILYKEISKTSRFGQNISNMLKNVCIEKYDTFESLKVVESFAPHFIIYENEEELLQQYRELIKVCEQESESFFRSTKKDAIVSFLHDDLEHLFSAYKRPSIKSKKDEGQIKKIYNFLMGLLSKELDTPFKQMKENCDTNLDCKVKLSNCIIELIKKEPLIDLVIFNLENVIAVLTSNSVVEFSIIDIHSQLKSFHRTLSTQEIKRIPEGEPEFYIGTIHSVKGEKHRSTMLVIDTIFRDYTTAPPTEYWMFDLLKEYFAGNYTIPAMIPDRLESNETIKSLKLAYVALSRPTHLTVIAIPASLISKEDDIFQRLDNNGWQRFEQKAGSYV
ncbi:UvrD-helicase domain-containing protein [Bacillus sp. ISL-7]|uniref:UvrD-helicase domain-containing protein n=1 Tax=Bacillus sp. ISL-7 TaxID=2819136 RepID=UPI001BEB5019|nr:UvrD-helicase domain-containing protein [Bacillus sp. ISL-7]MBT2734732.1 ATP-dependent helicase [Bacillus sp. ISL-7]